MVLTGPDDPQTEKKTDKAYQRKIKFSHISKVETGYCCLKLPRRLTLSCTFFLIMIFKNMCVYHMGEILRGVLPRYVNQTDIRFRKPLYDEAL